MLTRFPVHFKCFDFHDSRYTSDEHEEIIRYLRQSIQREIQTARYLDKDRPTERPTPHPMLLEYPRKRTATFSHASLSSCIEMQRTLRETERHRDQYLPTRSTTSSAASSLERAILAASHAVAQPRSVILANPSRNLATPSTEEPKQEPSPEAKMRSNLLDLLWPQPVGLIHTRLSKSRVKSSGEWVFTLSAFEEWRKASTESFESVKRGRNCLWLQGELGVGKTMLM